jgi:hypothetical protein
MVKKNNVLSQQMSTQKRTIPTYQRSTHNTHDSEASQWQRHGLPASFTRNPRSTKQIAIEEANHIGLANDCDFDRLFCYKRQTKHSNRTAPHKA